MEDYSFCIDLDADRLIAILLFFFSLVERWCQFLFSHFNVHMLTRQSSLVIFKGFFSSKLNVVFCLISHTTVQDLDFSTFLFSFTFYVRFYQTNQPYTIVWPLLSFIAHLTFQFLFNDQYVKIFWCCHIHTTCY